MSHKPANRILAALLSEHGRPMDRHTFEIPEGFVAVRDAEGRATGELVQADDGARHHVEATDHTEVHDLHRHDDDGGPGCPNDRRAAQEEARRLANWLDGGMNADMAMAKHHDDDRREVTVGRIEFAAPYGRPATALALAEALEASARADLRASGYTEKEVNDMIGEAVPAVVQKSDHGSHLPTDAQEEARRYIISDERKAELDAETMSWDIRTQWAENFLSHYASGDRQKLIGGYDFHAAVRHLAGALQQLTTGEAVPAAVQKSNHGPFATFGQMSAAASAHLPTDAKARKALPIATGVLDYFPDALAAVAEVSRIGNDQHNPGQPLHWSKGKSTDHADCAIRHFAERYEVDTDGGLHGAKAAWRMLADLQISIEAKRAGMTYADYIAHLKAQEAA